MFETRFPQRVTAYAANASTLLADYADCWNGLTKRFDGASAYKAQGIVASQETYRLIEERGQQDWDSSMAAFPACSRMPKAFPA